MKIKIKKGKVGELTKEQKEYKKTLEEALKTKSTYTISKEMGTYPNKIRRDCEKLGIKLPSHSEAQKLALEQGNVKHPTKGKERTDEDKIKISQSVYDTYKNMTDEEKEKISETHKEIWDKLTVSEKEAMQTKAAKALRKTTTEGSKTEKYIRDGLIMNGFTIDYHKKGLIPNEKLEIDILIPSHKTIIEINGPSHYEAIHGEEILKKKKRADSQKYGLLLSSGFNVIVVKHLVNNVCQAYHRTLLGRIMGLLESINKFNKKPEIIHVEV